MVFPTFRQVIRQKFEAALHQVLERIAQFISQQSSESSMGGVRTINVPPSAQARAAKQELNDLQSLFENPHPNLHEELEKLGYSQPYQLAELFAKAKGHPYPEDLMLQKQQWWEAYQLAFEEAIKDQECCSWSDIFYFLNFHINPYIVELTVAG
jgi:hypothetical protein